MQNINEAQGMLWERYTLYIDLFKFYFGVTLKINAFYLAVTGAIVTFYFANRSIESVELSLWFPIFMSVAIAVLFGFGIATIGALESDIKLVINRMGIETRVTLTSLYFLWWGSIVMPGLAGIAMVVIICKHS